MLFYILFEDFVEAISTVDLVDFQLKSQNKNLINESI